MVLELSGPKADFKRGWTIWARWALLWSRSRRTLPGTRKVHSLRSLHGRLPHFLPVHQRKTMEVLFDTTKCTGCELCIKACPPRPWNPVWCKTENHISADFADRNDI